MIPIGDARNRFSFPWMTTLLFLIGVILFLFEHFSPAGAALVDRLALVPGEAILYRPIWRLGQALLCLLPQGRGWLEPIVNLVYLWALGRKVEDACGPGGLILLGLSGGIGGVILALILVPNGTEPIYGLGGVVAGLLGAYFVLYQMEPIRTWFPPLILARVPASLHLLYWAGLSFVNLDRESLWPIQLARIFFLESTWPFFGGFFIGLLAGHLFARREFLYYRKSQAQAGGR